MVTGVWNVENLEKTIAPVNGMCFVFLGTKTETVEARGLCMQSWTKVDFIQDAETLDAQTENWGPRWGQVQAIGNE